ncbi:uncharacterized protein LOC142331438 isoform X2 [Lycorma delicatula]|uniref:uncharacterized protein LOC142331438 isoform X2 n=1 Tax=Lycorma delicatula TaxID=130591 RepID=UPI003F516C26
MEESKSVPGARKVRKQSSGGRSGRSSRKSSLSSIASSADNDVPDTSELTSENLELNKNNLLNGTHSDEDQITEQNNDKIIEESVIIKEDKKIEVLEVKKIEVKCDVSKKDDDTPKKTESIEKDRTDKVESSDKVKIKNEEEQLNETDEEREKEVILNKEVESGEEIKKGDEKEKKDKNNSQKIIKEYDNDSLKRTNINKAFVQLKRLEETDITIDKKNKKTDNSESEKENLLQLNVDKKKDVTEGRANTADVSDGNTAESEHKQVTNHSRKQSSEIKEKEFIKEDIEEEEDDEEIKRIDDIVIKESNSSDEEDSIVNRNKDGECSEDDSTAKLDFIGFESVNNEKSTMFFRILDDIRIDDSVMEDIADGEGDIESEKRDEVNKDDILSTTSSTPSLSSVISGGGTSRKRTRDKSVKKQPVDLTLPQYLKPFEFGWKRELVFRSVSDSGTKRNADIYYYTPKGKKVRSTREVVENLTDPELTIDNFTFFKEPIGINDPEKEIIREAKIRGDRDQSSTPPPSKKVALPKTPKLVEAKTSKTPPTSASVSPSAVSETTKTEELSPSKASPSFSSTPKIVLKSVKLPPKSKSAKPFFTHPSKGGSKDKRSSRDSEDELEMGMLPPLWPTPPEKGTAREISPATKVSGSKTIEVCSIRCPLAMGLIPTLQCHLCLCLYHPECVGLEEAINRTIHSYVCKNCQEAKKGGGITGTVLNKATPPVLTSPPPLTPISTIGSNSNTGQSSAAAPPKLQRLTDSKLPTTSKSQKIVGGVTTWLPPSSMIQLTSKNTSSSKTSAPSSVATVETASALGSMPAQTLMSMNGKRYVVVPKHNILSVSPAITTSGLPVSDSQPPVSTLVSCNSPTNDTSVSSSISNSLITTSTANPVVPSISVIANSVPTGSTVTTATNNNASVLPKPIGLNPGDPSPQQYLMNTSTTPTNPPGVLLVPCVTTTASNSKEGSKFVIVNGPSGLPTGNFIIGNIPPQQQLQLPAVPTTQPAVPSNETGGGVKRLNDDSDKLPPAKRPKKESPQKKETSTTGATSITPKPANTALPPAAVTPQQSTSAVTPLSDKSSGLHKDYFMMNMSAIYKALLHSFQYLKVQELLRASRVCHLWRDIAHHKSLWQTVRMKNSRVRDWEGFANMLRSSGTKHLDLRKMLVPDKQEIQGDMWSEYARAIERVNMLLRIDMCRCPASAVENSVRKNSELQVLSALAIRSNSLNMAAFENCKHLTELRLKSSEKGGMELKNLTALKQLTRMKHLSLLTVKNMPAELSEVFESLVNLESVELGECSTLPESIAVNGLSKVNRLQRLRLEKGHGPSCPTIPLLNTISKLPTLTQLELINFDIKPGFDTALSNCTNLRTLLIIPTYVTQSATTNHVVMEGVSKLSKTLMHFVWGITLELLRVTDLFIDQWEGQKVPIKSPSSSSSSSSAGNTPKKGSGDSIPILKPLNEDSSKEGGGTPSQVDILQLPKLHKVLTALLPTTKIKILKVPFSATWRQTVTGPSNLQ